MSRQSPSPSLALSLMQAMHDPTLSLSLSFNATERVWSGIERANYYYEQACAGESVKRVFDRPMMSCTFCATLRCVVNCVIFFGGIRVQ